MLSRSDCLVELRLVLVPGFKDGVEGRIMLELFPYELLMHFGAKGTFSLLV